MSILACSGFEEGPGANFNSPTLGQFMQKQKSEQKRFREAKAGALVAREGKKFHEKQARKHGINTNRGLAHFRASKMYTREGNRLQEMFENGGEVGELPPKAIIKANKAAMVFHKKSAEKAGLDSDVGHAHVAAMEHHADIMKRAKQQHLKSKNPQQDGENPKEAKFGYSGKSSPVPVPNKAKQPSEDIRQNKPLVKVKPANANGGGKRLQQNESYRKRETGSNRGPDFSLDHSFPKKTEKLMKPNLVFRGKKQKMFDPRKSRENQVFVAPRDQDSKEGYEDSRYVGIKKKVNENVKRSMESRRSDEDGPSRIDLRDFYTTAERGNGWSNPLSYSPPTVKRSQDREETGIVIREF